MFLRRTVPAPEATVTAARRIVGGASRHTWSVDVTWGPSDTVTLPEGLIFRLDPPASLLASNRGTEYAMYRAISALGTIPVPRPLLIEDDEAALGMPFFVMERLEGVAWPPELLEPELEPAREGIVRRIYRILGSLATLDPVALGLDQLLTVPAPGDAWAVELERWERTLAAHDLGPMPITEALIRELRRHPPPPPASVGIVHGDYRIGNVLFTPQGVVGILDWEMAHLGDPHEDLAWSMARNWRSRTAPERIGAALTVEEALAEWERASGLDHDPEALRWWGLFCHVKAIAIWVTGAHEFATGRTDDLMLAFLGWLSCGAQERWMLDDLGVTP